MSSSISADMIKVIILNASENGKIYLRFFGSLKVVVSRTAIWGICRIKNTGYSEYRQYTHPYQKGVNCSKSLIRYDTSGFESVEVMKRSKERFISTLGFGNSALLSLMVRSHRLVERLQ